MSTPDLAVMQAALVGTADPEIVALEARIRAAQLAADVAALDFLIADELLFTGPDGRLGTKAQDLDAHGLRDPPRTHRELGCRGVGCGYRKLRIQASTRNGVRAAIPPARCAPAGAGASARPRCAPDPGCGAPRRIQLPYRSAGGGPDAPPNESSPALSA